MLTMGNETSGLGVRLPYLRAILGGPKALLNEDEPKRSRSLSRTGRCARNRATAKQRLADEYDAAQKRGKSAVRSLCVALQRRRILGVKAHYRLHRASFSTKSLVNARCVVTPYETNSRTGIVGQ